MKLHKHPRGVIIPKTEDHGSGPKPIQIPEERLTTLIYDYFQLSYINAYLETRNSGEFSGSAIYLSDSYEWVIVRDSEGALCLVPLVHIKWLSSRPKEAR